MTTVFLTESHSEVAQIHANIDQFIIISKLLEMSLVRSLIDSLTTLARMTTAL